MRIKQLVRAFITSTTFLGAVLLFQAAVAMSQGLAKDLAPQPLAQALEIFAADTGLQLVYRADIAAGLNTHGAKAGMSAEDTLRDLLSETGLAFRFLNDRTIAIVDPKVNRRSSPVRDEVGPVTDGTTAMLQSLVILLAQDNPGAQGTASSSTQAASSTSKGQGQPGGTDLGEILVTAQKRTERLLDVPISIVNLSADELQRRGIANIDDLPFAVPGLFVNSEGSSYRQIMLRGIGNNIGTSSLIGLYLDEAAITSAFQQTQPDLRVYDLERIEVLRGPQSTLYGEGSVGGTIRFITRDPVLDDFEMKADVAVLYLPDGAPGQRIDGMLNVPLVEDELGLRIAGTFDHGAGWIDQPAVNDEDFNDQDLVNLRVKALWQPAPQFTANLMAIVHRNDGSFNTREDDNGDFTQVLNLATQPSVDDDYDLYNLTLAYDFSAAQIVSTSTYLEQEKEIEHYGGQLPILGPPDVAPPFEFYEPLISDHSHTFTDELRLVSTGPQSWQWAIGASFRHAKQNVAVPEFFFAPSSPPGTPLPPPVVALIRTENLFESWAVFGDTSYKFSDRLTLGIGVRYFEEEQEFANGLFGTMGPTLTESFHSVNPRAYLQYKVSDQVSTYASAAKGFRSGGFNGQGAPSYDPESVWTYELGSKVSLRDAGLDIEAAIFYSDYSDYQINGLVGDPPLNVVSNAGNAWIRGVELGLFWRASERWSLGINGDYIESEFYEIAANNATHIVGDSVDMVPEYAYTLTTQRDFQWSGRSGFVRLDYNRQGPVTLRNRRNGPWWYGESDIIDMLNFRLNMRWNDRLSVGVLAQNLLDDRGHISPDIMGSAARSRPLTFGLEVEMIF